MKVILGFGTAEPFFNVSRDMNNEITEITIDCSLSILEILDQSHARLSSSELSLFRLLTTPLCALGQLLTDSDLLIGQEPTDSLT